MVTETTESQQIITIDNVSLSSLGIFMLFDEINEITSKMTCEFLLKSNILFPSSHTVTMFINSQGGNVSDGWAIVDVMGTSHIGIQTVGIGEIASMAAIIFIAGDKGKRILSKNSFILTHQFSGILAGKSHEMVAARKIHDRLEDQFIKFFKQNTKMTEKQVRDILLRESDTYLEPKEALKYGLCDKISDPWPIITQSKNTNKE